MDQQTFFYTGEAGKPFSMVAKTFAGMEQLLANELGELDAQEVTLQKRAVTFKGDLKLLYAANYRLRTALRILTPIHRFTANTEQELYDGAYAFRWERFLDLRQSFAIDSVVHSKRFRHSKYAALKVKDAIADYYRDKFKKRPSVNPFKPAVQLHLHIKQNECTLLLDSSGESLHKRYYRRGKHPAPLNEVLAAGLVQLSGWNAQEHFVDPMCGSGTLLIEAAMYALKVPPGYLRQHFSFMRWKNFNLSLWHKVKQEGKKDMNLKKLLPFQIIGSDIEGMALRTAKENILEAGLHEHIQLKQGSFHEQKAPEGKGTLITNPPYGKRLEPEDILSMYKELGDKFKKAYTDYQAWIFTSNVEALKKVGLKADKKLELYNGPLLCRFYRYVMFEGSRDPQKKQPSEAGK